MSQSAKTNVITYSFEGNILNLQAALQTVEQLLKKSVKNYKSVQDKKLTADQQANKKRLESYVKYMKETDDLEAAGRTITKDRAARTKAAGAYVLKESKKMYNDSLKVIEKHNKDVIKADAQRAKEELAIQKRQQKEADDLAQKRTEALTPAGRESAAMQARYFDITKKELGSFLSERAINDITNSVAYYNKVVEELGNKTELSAQEQDKLADAIIDVNDKFKAYNSTMQTVRKSIEANKRSTLTYNDLISQFKERIELASKSLNTYIRILRRLFQLIKSGIEYFSAYVESLNFLEIASEDSASAMLKFANMQALSFGLSPTKVNQTAAMFYSLADSLGIAAENASLMSQNMTKLAEDMAALYNVDLEVMTQKLRSGLAGRTQAMQQLGIVVSDTAVNEWLLSKGIKTTMANMNEASQAMARYVYILEHTEAAQGALAREIKTPANQLRIFKTQLEELVKYIGAIATRIFLPLLRVLNYLLQPLNAFLKGLTDISSRGFTTAMGDISESSDETADSIENLNKVVGGLSGLDEINQMANKNETGKVYGNLNEEIQALMTSYDNMSEKLGGLAKLFYRIGEIFSGIISLFNGESLFTLLGEGLDWLLGKLANLMEFFDHIQEWIEGLPLWLQGIFKGLSYLLTTCGDLILTILAISAAMSIWKGLMSLSVFKNFTKIIGDMIKSIGTLIKTIWTKITARKAETVADNENTIAQGANATGTAANATAKTVDTVATKADTQAKTTNTGVTAANTAANNANAVSGAAAGMGKVAAAGLGAPAVAALIAGGLLIVGSAVAAIIAMVSKSKAQQNTTPAMATGGVVDAPTLALIGEGQYNEAVVPLGNSPQFRSMKEDIADSVIGALRGRHSGSNTPIVLNINGKEFARTILPDLEYALPQSGLSLRRA